MVARGFGRQGLLKGPLLTEGSDRPIGGQRSSRIWDGRVTISVRGLACARTKRVAIRANVNDGGNKFGRAFTQCGPAS